MISRDETQQRSGWNDLDLWLMNGSDSLKKFGRGLARMSGARISVDLSSWSAIRDAGAPRFRGLVESLSLGWRRVWCIRVWWALRH